MNSVTVVIPNFNGMAYIENCIDSLIASQNHTFPIIVVDDCSTDGSRELVRDKYPQVTLMENDHNLGFAGTANAGVRASTTPYVILLNNDTIVKKGFVKKLAKRIKSNDRYFSCQALMVSMKDPTVVDTAGDFYNILGWARARGKDEQAAEYNKPCDIFSSCGGAVIYRRQAFLDLGLFDEAHFAYLEDVDIGFRALLRGYRNIYEPGAVVLHAGSASSGSRHNAFKVELSAGNSLYLAYKNLHPIQLLLNAPALLTGHFIKILYFAKKGLFVPYLKGIKRGLKLIKTHRDKLRTQGDALIQIPVQSPVNPLKYVKIQLLLIVNLKYLLPF